MTRYNFERRDNIDRFCSPFPASDCSHLRRVETTRKTKKSDAPESDNIQKAPFQMLLAQFEELYDSAFITKMGNKMQKGKQTRTRPDSNFFLK